MRLSFPIFIFLFLLVLTPFISAQADKTQQNININIGLQIEFTQVDIIENGEHHLFNAHVFNISSGQRVTNVSTDCNFHLFDNLGEHQINQVPMIFDSLGLDFEHNVTGNNFTRNGEYSFLVVCNSTSFGGFLSKGITVTQDGKETIPFPKEFSVIFLGFILIMFGLFKERFRLLKHMGSLLLMVMGILTLFPGYNNISHTSLLGLTLGSLLIGIGFYFLVEDSFSRTRQEGKFNQDQGEDEFDEEEFEK